MYTGFCWYKNNLIYKTMKKETFTNECYICNVTKTNCSHLLCLDCDKDNNNK
mgnify:CR=1 FL=1